MDSKVLPGFLSRQKKTFLAPAASFPSLDPNSEGRRF